MVSRFGGRWGVGSSLTQFPMLDSLPPSLNTLTSYLSHSLAKFLSNPSNPKKVSPTFFGL